VAASLTKAAGEIEKLFKKLQTPGKSPKTYWQVITEQVEEEGVWDEEFLNLAKEQIGAYLNKFDNEKLFDLWEQSEAASENFTERSELKPDSVKSDLKEELLNLILDKFDSGSHTTNYYEGESYYIENAKDDDSFDDDEFNDDIKDIDLNTDDLFDDDDDYFEDDDRF
jgi:hypothetical protein